MHKVTVLYITFMENIKGDMVIEENASHGVRDVIVYCKKSSFRAWNKWRAFKKAIEYFGENDRLTFDVVHHNVIWNSGWQALWLRHKFGWPYVITEHWTGFGNERKNEQSLFLKPFAKRVTRNASMICPVSTDLAVTMREFGLDGNYRVVPNVVDTSIFTWKNRDDSIIRFLHVSSLVDDHKNITGILEAWKLASGQNDHIHLTIGGDGPWRQWETISDSLGISKERITFFGEKDPPGIASLMSVSHCLLLFSKYENMPVVIIEALASGMAIISSDVGGIREHITPERGYLVSAKDNAALTTAILTFAQEYSRFDGDQLRAYAIDNFSVEAVAAAYDEVYRKLVDF